MQEIHAQMIERNANEMTWKYTQLETIIVLFEAEQFFNDTNVFELMLALLCGRYNKNGIKWPIKWNSWC